MNQTDYNDDEGLPDWMGIAFILFVLAIGIIGACSGCAAKPVEQPPTGLQDAGEAAAALKENIQAAKWHAERIK